MKTLLIIVISSLLFGFTQQYYTDKNTDIIKAKDGTTTIIDKNGEPINGAYFINSEMANSFIFEPFENGKVHGILKYFSNDMDIYSETAMKNGDADGTKTTHYLFDNKTINISDYIKSDNLSDIVVAFEQISNFFKENGYIGLISEYSNGEKHGIQTSYDYFYNGLYIGVSNYSKGVMHGLMSKCYYSAKNSECDEFTFMNGYKNGMARRIINGAVVREINYKNDELKGFAKAYEDDLIIEITPFFEGKMKGKGYYFDKNGNKIIEINYKDNKRSYLKILNNSANSKSLKIIFPEDKYSYGYCYISKFRKKFVPPYKLMILDIKLYLKTFHQKPSQFEKIETFSKLGLELCN